MGPRLDGRGDRNPTVLILPVQGRLQWGRGLMAAVTGEPVERFSDICERFNGAAA